MNSFVGRRPFRGAPGLGWVVPMALAFLAAFPCGASVVNGDFGAGLTGWTAAGNVAVASVGSLGDSGVDHSLLYQAVALAPGSYRLEFDFLNLLSSDDSQGFPDAFFATLYFIDNAATFDPDNGIFDDMTALMDLDFAGPYNAAGVLSPSVLGPDWTHFAFDFTNAHGYAIPFFELFGLNAIQGDSVVRLDNVEISPYVGVVPEPATLTLSVLGLLGWASTLRRSRKGL